MIVTVANQKGGVGKTTTAVSLAHGLAIQGREALLVDLDPQGHAATMLGLEREPGVYDWIVREKPWREVVRLSGRERLAVMPGDKRTSRAMTFLTIEYGGRGVPVNLLWDRLRPALRNGLDYVVIDTAPSASELQAAAMAAADLVVIPAACEFLSEEAVADTLETIGVLLGLMDVGAALNYVVLPTFYDERANASRDALAEYRRTLPNNVLGPIHAATRFRDAAAAGRTIFEVEPNGRPAQEYAALVWFVRAWGGDGDGQA
jgi:chromosome partitioning protein